MKGHSFAAQDQERKRAPGEQHSPAGADRPGRIFGRVAGFAGAADTRRVLRAAIAAAVFCGAAAAQCSMCRNAVAAQGSADTFDRAILILLVPAVAIFSSVFIFVYRFGNSEPVGDPRRGRDEGTVD